MECVVWQVMSMNILDFIEAWWTFRQANMEASGVTARFERSPNDRLNPSCSLNLRRGQLEADLVAWESGDAELGVVGAGGLVSQTHFDDLRNQEDLSAVLSRLIGHVSAPQKQSE